jgi:toxin ParE1/3/4
MTRTVIFSPEAENDLSTLYTYISEQSGSERALGYIERLATHCERLATFPERGQKRDDLRPGLRITGFERRVTIAFHVTLDCVVIDRLLYAGRDVGVALDQDNAFR